MHNGFNTTSIGEITNEEILRILMENASLIVMIEVSPNFLSA